MSNASGSGPPTKRQIFSLLCTTSAARKFCVARASRSRSILEVVARRCCPSSSLRVARLRLSNFSGWVRSSSCAFASHQQGADSLSGRFHFKHFHHSSCSVPMSDRSSAKTFSGSSEATDPRMSNLNCREISMYTSSLSSGASSSSGALRNPKIE